MKKTMPPLSFHARQPIASLDDLSSFARRLALTLGPGDVVAMNGPLGAGKTTLARLLGEAIGLREPVTSPTFVLMHEYLSGPFPVIHADLYRLGPENAETLAEALFASVDEGRSLVLVEWACYGDFLESALSVLIEIGFAEENPELREIKITANRPLWEGAEWA